MESVKRVKREAARANEEQQQAQTEVKESVKWYDGPMFGYTFRTLMILIIYIRLRRGIFLEENESVCGGFFRSLPPLKDSEDLWQTFCGLFLMDLDLTIILSTVIHDNYANTDFVKAFSLMLNLAGIYFTAAGLSSSPKTCKVPLSLQRSAGRSRLRESLPARKLQDFSSYMKRGLFNPAGIQSKGGGQ